MKFRKEYQTYLLIVIAIITAGYFLKPFFFNKKKKVIEGQAGTTTYYRIAFNSTDSIVTSALTLAEQDLLKELILTQYDTVLTAGGTTGSKYVQPGNKYKDLIPLIPDTDTLLIKDSTGAVLGLKVVALCANRLEYFKEKAAAVAAADTADSAAAAAAAYDYARLILSNTYKDAADKADNIMALKPHLNIMALIATANLFTITSKIFTITDNKYEEALTAVTIAFGRSNYFLSLEVAVDAGGALFVSDAAKAIFVAKVIAMGKLAQQTADSQQTAESQEPVDYSIAKSIGLDPSVIFISDAAEDAFEDSNNAKLLEFARLFGLGEMFEKKPTTNDVKPPTFTLEMIDIDAVPVDYYATALAAYAVFISVVSKKKTVDNVQEKIAYAVAFADAYAKGIPLTSATITDNDNYKKVMAKDPVNLTTTYTTAASLIYQSIYEIINKI